MSKENTFYFSHDYNARNDKKMIRLKQKHRMTGIGVFWSIVEMLYEEGGKLLISDVPTIAIDLKEKEGVIKSIIEDFDLFKNDGTNFWSESVNRRINKRLSKSEKAKASAESRWQNANALRPHSERNAIKERKGKDIKVKDIDIKEKDSSKDPPSLPIKTDEELSYERFNLWLKENAPEVLHLKYQISLKNYIKLFRENEPEKVKRKLIAMHNTPRLLKDYKDVYATVTNWLKYPDREDETKVISIGPKLTYQEMEGRRIREEVFGKEAMQ